MNYVTRSHLIYKLIHTDSVVAVEKISSKKYTVTTKVYTSHTLRRVRTQEQKLNNYYNVMEIDHK